MDSGKRVSDLLSVLKNHEERIAALEDPGRIKKRVKSISGWYRPGSTIAKVITLLDDGFFHKPRSMSDMIIELKTKDFHLKPSDLTLPLRRIVRKGLLKKTRTTPDGSVSKNWLYVKVKT